MCNWIRSLSCSLALCSLVGCTVDAPLDPANLGRPLDNIGDAISNAFENAIEDPLDQSPYPVILGGDSERVLYATNLSDIRVNFPGPTGVLILPGYFGPSNVYKIVDKERSLVGPLVPAGTLTGLATDGRTIAFMSLGDLATAGDDQLVAIAPSELSSRVIYDAADDAWRLAGQIAVDDGRVAFSLNSDVEAAVRIVDLIRDSATVEFAAGEYVQSIALHGSRLAYLHTEGGVSQVALRDLETDVVTTVDGDVRTTSTAAKIFLSENRLVWSESSSPDGLSRVSAFDIPSGETRVLAEGVAGDLAGASDAYFLTQELVERMPDHADQIVIRRFDSDGKEKKLADFRSTGLAGQATILGDRAVWVNPARRIFVAPLAGGARRDFAPY